ncbi:MAG: hypothetical protein KF798_01990 [Candidatus Paracaedibacteraceae bacterium]|nr:hypothetical protein [Candidatus Paracaedibacteraceae bacterium]
MIVDIFSNRAISANFSTPNILFIQFLNLTIECSKPLNVRIDKYPYEGDYSNKSNHILQQSQRILCNEMGYKTLDKADYKELYGILNDRIVENFIYDETVDCVDKMSLFELIFREMESHFINEIQFLGEQIPVYTIRSDYIKDLSQKSGTNYHNDGEELLSKSRGYLVSKQRALQLMRTEIKDRLKQHKLSLTYHNGFFQKDTDSLVEERVSTPFWELVSDSKYKNIETDMLTAFDRYESRERDSAFYAAKALESMIKIICKEKKIKSGNEKTANAYLNTLSSKQVIIKDEFDELTALFRIRNWHGHGLGDEVMPKLTMEQELRFIHSAMLWIYNLSQR